MKLILIRHADPDYENDALTEKGHEQAAKLAERMKGSAIDEFFVSPMGRAQITAGYISDSLGIKPETLDWLHELNGNYKDELWAWNQHGCDLHAENTNWDLENWNEHVPYGDHMTKVASAFYKEFDDFMRERGYNRNGALLDVGTGASEKTVLFVCHGGVILTLLAHLLSVPLPIVYAHFEISPSGRTELTTSEKNGRAFWRLEFMNDMSHAEELRTSVKQTGTF